MEIHGNIAVYCTVFGPQGEISSEICDHDSGFCVEADTREEAIQKMDQALQDVLAYWKNRYQEMRTDAEFMQYIDDVLNRPMCHEATAERLELFPQPDEHGEYGWPKQWGEYNPDVTQHDTITSAEFEAGRKRIDTEKAEIDNC